MFLHGEGVWQTVCGGTGKSHVMCDASQCLKEIFEFDFAIRMD